MNLGHLTMSSLPSFSRFGVVMMEQILDMGSFGVIRNGDWVARYSTLIEHIYINASPPSVQNDIAILPWNDHPGRQEVMWAAHRNIQPRFLERGETQ